MNLNIHESILQQMSETLFRFRVWLISLSI